jgi:hypothetical protein
MQTLHHFQKNNLFLQFSNKKLPLSLQPILKK